MVDDRAPQLAAVHPPSGIELPFTTRMPAADRLVITMHRSAGSSDALCELNSYAWVEEFRGTIEVDLSDLELAQSMFFGWVVNVMRTARSASVELTHCSERMREILHLLGVDMVVRVTG